MDSMANPYLSLLAELGIDIPEDVWNDVHNIPPPPPPPSKGPERPHHYAEDGVPVFLSSQLEYCEPEVYGFHEYDVIETDDTAHPFALDYKTEVYYRGNYRPIHRYSREYRIRWVFFHLVGSLGKVSQSVLSRLRSELAKEEEDILWTRRAYEWVRAHLRTWKMPHLYISIPYIVSRLGGRRWSLDHYRSTAVLDDAIKLHRLFEVLSRAGKLKRQRFPNLTFVLLFLMDRHGITSPYRIPWARTYIRRKCLRGFLSYMQDCLSSNTLPDQQDDQA